MGQLKKQALENVSEDIQTHVLSPQEMNYVRLLNMTLTYHTHGSKIVSGFLYYVSTTRLGYKNGVNLQFEIDLDKDDNILSVKLLPEDVSESPAPLDNEV